jgi:predicted kinase
MTHQPTLTVLCGLPGSGKSHWATEHAGSAVVLTGDSIRTGADPGRTFDGMRAECSRLLALGRDVLIDACSLTRRSRLEWLGIASTTRAQANLVLIDTHEDECASRNRTRHDRARVDWAKLRKQWAETTVAVHGEPWASIRVVRG